MGVTSAGQITDLSGFGGLAGGSISVTAIGGGGEIVFGPVWPGKGKTYVGGELSLGVGLVPAEVHGQATYTKVNKYFNIKDIYKNPKVAAKGYLKLQFHALKNRTYIDEMIDLIGLFGDSFKDKESEKK